MATSTTAPDRAPDVSVQATDLVVAVRRELDGPPLAREPVLAGDVSEIFAELWREGWLRRGRPDVPYDALAQRVTVRLADGSDSKCAKLVFEAADGEGHTRSSEPPTQAFQDVATRAAQALLEAEILKQDDVYYYHVHLRPTPRGPSEKDGPQFTVRAKSRPLEYMKRPIQPLLDAAETIGTVDEDTFPVFYTTDVLARAQRFAQQGAANDPPTETGGVLVGPLCACPETGELFVVVCDVLEARDAEGSSLSLAYTGKTWARIQAVIRAKQARPETRAYRIVGQVHGHNVMPGSTCAECEKADTCKLTSVFVSHEDRTWSKAVFAKQPWHLCHIFGLNARGKAVHALYGLRENRLAQRGFYRLAEFDPGARETQPAISD
jgi:hypothetical protein